MTVIKNKTFHGHWYIKYSAQTDIWCRYNTNNHQLHVKRAFCSVPGFVNVPPADYKHTTSAHTDKGRCTCFDRHN